MISLKRIFVALAAIAPLAFASAAYAVTVPSDYAKDVKDGNSQVSSDPAAKTQQNEVKDGENVEGDVDNDQVEVDEQVEPQEATEPAEAAGDSGSAAEPSSSTGANN